MLERAVRTWIWRRRIRKLKRMKWEADEAARKIAEKKAKMKRMVCPEAMRVLRLRPQRRFVRLDRLCSSVGWKYQGVIEKLEAKRKARSHAWYQKRKALNHLRSKARAETAAGPNAELLAAHGR